MNAVGFSSASDHGPFTQRVAAGHDSSIDSRPAESVFDVGIVLADRPGYLCVPFERVGLSPAAQVEHLRASCECIDPRVVSIFSDRGDVVPALLLEFVPDPASDADDASAGLAAALDTGGGFGELPDLGVASSSSEQPVGSAPSQATRSPRGQNLGVIVGVALSDGATHQFRVDLLHTTLHREDQR
ncbi:MAG: hypothetical protein KatS3mg111_0756 [Pirellulaceae bacterium]|nr:MAG: hypothetical protein KatS3mg111_0756 [Pirellulaceae bacterium]